jgi:hypothetical protein
MIGTESKALNPVQVQEMLLSQPLSFIPNQGQAPPGVKYYAVSGTQAITVTSKGLVMRIPAAGSAGRLQTLGLEPEGLNPQAEITPGEPLAGKVNCFKGRDPQGWRTNIPSYGAVLYREAYPGIDLKFYGSGQHLEYDVIVQPGADPSRVRFRAPGAQHLTVNDQGDLVLSLPGGGEITQKKPVVYQEIDGRRVSREGGFQVAAGKPGTYGFALGPYDARYPLIIDPLVLVYSIILGGSTPPDRAEGVAVDASGNAYVTGWASSPDFPTTPGSYDTFLGGPMDAFVTKIGPDGTLLASTFLGGSSYDYGKGIAVDSAGNVYVAGSTESGDFPATVGAFQTTRNGIADAFVAKLNNSLSTLVYATYLGGTGEDRANAIALNQTGEAYVTGYTEFNSANFPTTAGAFQTSKPGQRDAFVTRFTAAGSGLVFSTYLGGSANDDGNAIAVDGSGQVYVAGNTSSTNFPTLKPYQAAKAGGADIFITKLLPDGPGLVFSTYLGGSGTDGAYGLAADGAGAAYVVGYTLSEDFPLANPIQGTFGGGDSDLFVSKLALTGDTLNLVYSTYLGGSGDEENSGIAVDGTGAAYVGGGSGSSDFPLKNNLLGVGGYGFLTKINPGGTEWVYSTRLPEGARAIALDPSGQHLCLAGGAWGSKASAMKVREAADMVGAIHLLLE